MKRHILKYRMQPGGHLFRARHDKIVKVAEQNGWVTVWIESRVNQHDERRYSSLFIVGTGQEIEDDDAEHVGTAMVGGHVWHVYQTTESPA